MTSWLRPLGIPLWFLIVVIVLAFFARRAASATLGTEHSRASSP